MNRRDLLKSIPALAAAGQLSAQPKYTGRLRPGLVAYTYRNELQSKKLTYEDVIRMVADFGLEGARAKRADDGGPQRLLETALVLLGQAVAQGARLTLSAGDVFRGVDLEEIPVRFGQGA